MKGGEKMEKGQLWTIVGVALVVAVVASIATASITGNVINVAKGKAGKVYTTAEVDAKWDQLRQEIAGTDIEVLEMLNQRCEVVDGSESGITNPEDYSCQNICSKKRADLVCTFGIGTFKVSSSTIGDQKVVVRSCQDRTSPYNTYLSCMCCHSP
jgi:hypothetical protein